MALFGRKIQKNNGLTVLAFGEGRSHRADARPFSFAARCAAGSLCGCSCASAPFRQREVLVHSPRRLPSRFALAAFPRGLLGFPPCRPPCNPPAKPPFRATKRIILWGGLFRGKTHFRGGNLALLSPLRGGHGAIARLAAWRVGKVGIRLRKASRRASRTNNPYKVQCTLVAARNIVRTQRPRQGCKAPRSGIPLTRFGFSEIMTHREGSDRRERPSLTIPVRNCRLLFYGMNCIIIQRR